MQPRHIRQRGRPERWLYPARAVNGDGIGTPGPGRPLPKVVRRILQPFFSVDLSKVRVHQGIPAWLATRAAVPNPAAMSYKYDIYIAPGYADLFKPSGWRTLIHELRHIEQYARLGPGMYNRYRQYAHKQGYWENPFEVDAYRFEAAVASELGI